MKHETLKVGSKGSEVVLCQKLLTSKGFKCSADGDFGKNTKKMVVAFQESVGLVADGIVGNATWEKLEDEQPEIELPIDFKEIAKNFSEMLPQRYRLKEAECPSNPPGVSLKRIGNDWTNCVLFTAWIISKSFNGVSFSGDQWKRWMISGGSSMTGNPPTVPNWGPRVLLEWGVGTTSPGPGVWLVQSFSNGGGHSFMVVDHCQESDKILTLEASSSHDGAGWKQIGPLRDVLNPGANWREKVTQTWDGRFGSFDAFHMVRLSVDAESVQRWLQEG